MLRTLTLPLALEKRGTPASVNVIANQSMPMKKPSNWIVVSGISRMRVITDHWFGNTPEGPPAPTAEVYETLVPTTGRSRPVIGSTIDVRASGCSVTGFQTGSD